MMRIPILLILLIPLLMLSVSTTGCSNTTINTAGSSPSGKTANSAGSGNMDISKIPLGSVLGKGKPTVADFGWRTCIPCKAMKPILEALAVEYKDRVNVVIVEVYDAENEKVVERYGIRAIPTQIIFDKDGKEVARNLGYIEKEQILLLLQKVGTY